MGFLKKLGTFGGTLVGGAIGVIDVLDGGIIDSYDADDTAMDSGVEVHDVSKQQLPVIVTSPEVVVKTGSFYFLVVVGGVWCSMN